eukprot:scaffold14894_cov32-Tisochrysis_lutea.AAC.1
MAGFRAQVRVHLSRDRLMYYCLFTLLCASVTTRGTVEKKVGMRTHARRPRRGPMHIAPYHTGAP